MFKWRWSKQLAKINVGYNHDNLERDIALTARVIGERLTPRIMTAADSYV